MEAYSWPRDRKLQYTKYYLNILKDIVTKATSQRIMAFKIQHSKADNILKYFKGSLQAKILLILTKSWAGHSSYTHLIISFRRVISNTHHGKSQIYKSTLYCLSSSI